HRLVLVLVQPVGEGRGGRLVDDAQNLQTGDAAGVLGRLALCVVEVRRYRDDCLGHPLTQELRGVLDQLAQHQRGDLLRRVQPVAYLEPHRAVRSGHHVERHRVDLAGDLVVAPADEALRRVDRPLGVQDRLPARVDWQDYQYRPLIYAATRSSDPVSARGTNRPWRSALTAASVRVATSSFARTCSTCAATVRPLMNSAPAIRLFCQPSTMSPRTSNSRVVRPCS